jgi:hypothetical protein
VQVPEGAEVLGRCHGGDTHQRECRLDEA